ncbi:hypothetical protein BTBSAS_130054 [Brochothrix thermosphacta]|uniref:Uncharacterized protein n=1 Tax=Brochothrix thermosphacta TaxID=2756 RepID=A0A2X0QEW4_BROTH|nr:hypothetical protein BTBSAS_130054 [Brochothrix thermosphacta]
MLLTTIFNLLQKQKKYVIMRIELCITIVTSCNDFVTKNSQNKISFN